MKEKKLIQALGFNPKENTSEVFYKKYKDYAIEVDFEKKQFDFGSKIKAERKATQNFDQAENWVVLECVDRLLEKGYPPQNITLEKTWKTGHGTSGRLDILVTRDDDTTYLMIECKTWGKEFEKELKNIHENGGQLFTYFQQDKDAEVIMLYASELNGKNIQFRNEIIKIEDDYRQTGNVKDLYERWNKQPKTNGVFDCWVAPYEFKSKALTINDLKVLKQEDSSYVFNRFLEILRHNVVSDKPNAFNKIFTLFLCKIVDENRNENDQLHFQWLEGQDDHISFQKRLTDLYNKGMLELLEKKVTDVSDNELDKQFSQVEERYKKKFKEILTEIRLKKNNEFAIKEVYDDASFEDNAKVVKEVVELLQVYRIRYNYRQQFLSDFFELLLTTGLKQESGQFFTPVPIARFIIRSLPFPEIADKKFEGGNTIDLLPTIIDYAAGSGHFITESMEEVQRHIDSLLDESKFNPTTKKAIKKWKADQFDWADDYVYGIEKDYRLVKTAKVSCYLHGDGLAKVIHGDGLGDFSTSDQFKDLLKKTDKTYPQDNKQFDIVISNPPYSVDAFKGQMNGETSNKGFDLFAKLTDQSSEIECLFVERTKQLLKDGGVAGIILPSSILSNKSGIYTQTRAIILKYFDVVAITELGANTFMATGTNTVILFLKRRNNADAYNFQEAIKKLFVNLQDVTINGIQHPLQKYIVHVWKGVSVDDYKTLLQKHPNEKIKAHEIYQEYDKKIKAKNEREKWMETLALEQDKLLYFILTYKQKIVLVKTGSKTKEKQFLGYEFSTRRRDEGIHPIQRSKTIDECTQLYDATTFENPEKASTYVYKAFNGELDLEIDEDLKENVSYQNLVDMLTFDRVDFGKNISLSVKKVRIESRWELKRFSDVIEVEYGKRIVKQKEQGSVYPVYGGGGETFKSNDFNREDRFIISRFGMSPKCMRYVKGKFFLNDSGFTVTPKSDLLLDSYLQNFLFQNQLMIYYCGRGVAQKNIDFEQFNALKIPLPPLDIQQKIVDEIAILEQQEQRVIEEIERLNNSMRIVVEKAFNSFAVKKLDELAMIKKGKSITKSKVIQGKVPVIAGGKKPAYFHNEANRTPNIITVSASGANSGFINYFEVPIFASDCNTIKSKNESTISTKLLFTFLKFKQQDVYSLQRGQAQPHVYADDLARIKIPFPPSEEQQKIVSKIGKIEAQITTLKNQIAKIPKQKEAILKSYLE